MSDSRQYVLWAFKMTGCVDCGFKPQSTDDLQKMDCDHRDPATKTRFDNIRGLAEARGFTVAGLFEELWGCDPVCRSCHIERTKQRGEEARDRERELRGVLPLPLKEWITETTNEW